MTDELKWESGQDIVSGWYKFSKVGDSIVGTLLSKYYKQDTTGIYSDQWVYELKTKEGVINVGISIKNTFVNNKLKYIEPGTIIGFQYTKDVPSTKFKGKIAKSIEVKQFGTDTDYLVTHQDQVPADEEEIKVDSAPFN